MPDITTYTDLELINTCIAGDEGCFEELVNRYKNLVYSIIIRQTNNRDDANDIAQDVFLKVYRNLNRYTPEFKFSTWVMRITTNHVIDFHRKRKQETVPFEDSVAVMAADPEDSPEAALLRREEKKRIQKIVDELPKMYRLPIVMYHEQGMS